VNAQMQEVLTKLYFEISHIIILVYCLIMSWTAEEEWFNSWQGQEIVLLSEVSGPIVGHT
jgi:hypothetical protein